MKRLAMRSVWNKHLPLAVLVVKKKVRGFPVACFGSDGLEGFDMTGAKAQTPFSVSRHG
jgi:hypothetical protein